ncbi:phage tail spike protein [Metabacillus idriensis]|uniref:phage tail spike protein n=1 Tax=Metabacillus idriensis TaxID=324768 RepID=UPI00174C6775|nr:phage tail spike protein [Metabacillus idriensis]
MLAIKDLQGEVYLLTGASNIVRKRRVNGEKELSLKLEKTKQNAHFFDDIDKLWRVIDFIGEEYPIVFYRDVAQGDSYTRDFSCLHSFFDDMRNHVIYGKFTGSKTFVDMMNFIFTGSGYTFNIIGSFFAQSFEDFGDDYGLELFKTALERYVSEFSVKNKIVTLQETIGNTTDFQYRHKFNLESIEREVDALDFSTYGEGFGKDELHVTYRSPLADIYGERPIKAIRDERFTVSQNLLDKVKEAVDSSLKITLTVKLSDLRTSGYNKNHPDEGDVIILVEDRFDMKVDTRIVEIVELLDKKGNVIDCDVTLSNFSNIFEQQRRIHNATKTIADAIEGKRPLPFEALAIAVQQATIALQNAQTELHFPDSGGILAIDKTNPNKLVLFNSAGIGISEDGGQTFKTAMTGAGFVADVITSGTINTAFVRIEGASGNIYITGDQFKAVDAINPNKFVEIIPGKITTSGSLDIIRPDGAVFMQDGIARNSLIVQQTSPAFIGDNIDMAGRYYRSFQSDYDFIGAYQFNHEGRYLIVRGFVLISSAGCGIAVESYAGLGFYQAVTILKNAGATEGQPFQIVVDLGVPTYSPTSFYIKMRSDNAPAETRCRVNWVTQYG